MFKFNVINKIPETVEQLKKMPIGLYKLRGRALIIISDEHMMRATYNTTGETTGRHAVAHVAVFDHVFNWLCPLRTQEELDDLIALKDKLTKTDKKLDKMTTYGWNFIYSIEYRARKQSLNNDTPQIGVELELETDNFCETLDCVKLQSNKLVTGTHRDTSVYQGIEINFTHGKIGTWKIKEIKKLLDECKKQHLDNRYGTAGMHVHVSGKGVHKAVRRIKEEMQDIQKILMPISSRRRVLEYYDRLDRYGVGSDCIRNQINDFGTIEFRCFEATTDPKIFKRRLEFCRTLFNYMAGPKPLCDFFKHLKPHEKENYKALLLAPDNEHYFGDTVENVLARLN